MNIELLEQTYQRIKKAKPAKVDMQHWCGTTACIAGHAVAEAGFKASVVGDGTEYGNKYGLLERRGEVIFGILYQDAPSYQRNGEQVRIPRDSQMFEEVARKQLGLTPKQAKRLFYTDQWPEEFETLYHQASSGFSQTTPAAQASAVKKVILARLRKFIDTNGKV